MLNDTPVPATLHESKGATTTQGMVSIPPQERSLVLDGGPKDFTYIVGITEAMQTRYPVADQITLHEGSFNRKKEFHLTLFGFSDRASVKQFLTNGGAEIDQSRMATLNSILSETDFSFSVIPDSLRVVTNKEYDAEAVRAHTSFESENTITVDVNVPGMVAFYEKIGRLGLDIPVPETHVTLFVKDNGDATGLGIAITKYEAQLEGVAHPHIAVRPMEF